MNLGRKPGRRPLFCALALACAFALQTFAQQRTDEAYGAKIKITRPRNSSSPNS
jgi:hypothetical protein